MNPELALLSERVGRVLAARGWTMASAESCTGGWIAEVVTATAGSSAWFDRGFVTYSNAAKREMLDVGSDTLVRHGAVSEQTVREMAAGALTHSQAQVAVAVSGIAGPAGGSADKPVGMVCLAWAIVGQPLRATTRHFDGDREAVRRQTVECALGELLTLLA